MASKVTGRATIFALAGTVTYTGVGTVIKESVDADHNVRITPLEDDDDEMISIVHSNEHYIASLLFTPIAASGTNTLANAAGSLAGPAVGAAVTLASFKAAVLNQTDWVYVGGWKFAGKKNGLASFSIKIQRSPNNNLSTAVT